MCEIKQDWFVFIYVLFHLNNLVIGYMVIWLIVSYAVCLLWITMRKYQHCAIKLIFRNAVYFLELIWLLGNIEPVYSLSYRFGLAQLSLAQFGPD